MKKSTKYTLLLFLLSISFDSIAEDIYDVVYNKTIEIKRHAQELESKYSNYKNTIDITYDLIAVENTESDRTFNELNLALCLSYLQQENKAISLNRDISERIAVHNELIYSSTDWEYSNRNSGVNTPPKLTDIDSRIISVVGNLYFIEMEFEYSIPSGNYKNESFNFMHYYVYNTQEMSLKRWKNTLSRTQLDQIQNKIAKQLNEDYLIITAKLDRGDFGMIESGEEMEEKEVCKDICTKIDLQEADILWYGWGIVLQFQANTPSSKVYNGNAYQFFIPLEQAKELFANITQFDFIAKLDFQETALHHFNLIEFQTNLSVTTSFVDLNDILDRISDSQVKTITIKRYQLSNADNSKYYNGKTILEFNTQSKIISRSIFNQTETNVGNTFYSYDSIGNLVEQFSKNSREEASKTYTYDWQHNLTSVTHIDNSDVSKDVYLYNGPYIYQYQQNSIGSRKNNAIRRYKFDKDKFETNGSTVLLNKQQQIYGNLADKYVFNLYQVGYDSLGRKNEAHRDNDRYHYYWTYDDQNRLATFEYYEYYNIKKSVQYFYHEDSQIPTRMIEKQNSGGNGSVQIEEYETVFFE